jgi:hypothetical protein
MSKLITLEAWAAQVYGEAAPGLPTLRRWARLARISPRPIKHGRTYFVAPTAVYSPAFTGGGRPRLVDRLTHATKAPKRA